MKKPVVYILAAVIVLALAVVAYSRLVSRDYAERPGTQASADDLSRYEHSFVGDNSAVVNIVRALPEGKNIETFELQTTTEPYGVKLNGNDEVDGGELEPIARQLFRLVDNCDWVEIESPQVHAKIVRGGEVEYLSGVD